MGRIQPISVVSSALRDSDAGLPDADNAAKHGVSIKTIRRWRRDYQRRGKSRGQSHVGAPCPLCHGATLDAAAYAGLLGWYLGDGHISLGRRAVYQLHIYNDVNYQRNIAEVEGLVARVKPAARPHSRYLRGCRVVTAGWKHWPCLFPQHGPGRKHERTIRLEPWQREIVAKHPEALLRGLFLSDGCRVINWTVRPLVAGLKRYEYPRYMFSNESADIIGICSTALTQIGVPWTLPRRNLLSVARREDVARLDSFIGPKQ